MKRNGSWLSALIIILAMLASSCSSSARPETLIEPTALGGGSSAVQEPNPIILSDAIAKNFDASFNVFLGNMVGYNALHLADLEEMLAEEPPPFLLDVRSASEVEETGYIAGAVVIPLRELAQHLDLLPSFDTTIVSYCGSGWRCTIAMTALGALGWNSILVLKEGSYSGWAESEYPVANGMPKAVVLDAESPDPALTAVIASLLSRFPEDWGFATATNIIQEMDRNPDLIMIDVRNDDEVAASSLIEGSIHIPLEDFIDRKTDWPIEKDATIAIFSGYGHRSTIAMTILMAYGYSDVRSIGG